MINVLCDEFALTMHVDLDEEKYDQLYFEKYIDSIDNQMSLNEVLGNRIQTGGKNGYDSGVSFGYDNKRIHIYYSKNQPQMKVFLRFSAEALKNYRTQYNLNFDEDLEVIEMLKRLSEIEKIRLSRFDIAIDFIDENLIVDDLYQRIQSGEIQVFNKKNDRIETDHYVGKARGVETLYFNKRSSASHLRIYDKKIEQIENVGPYYVKANESEDWTRFELELKQSYAHRLTELLLNCTDWMAYQQILLNIFIDCFKFKYVVTENNYRNTDFYDSICKLVNNKEKLINVVGYDGIDDFQKKYESMKKQGGLTLFKMIKEAYGEEELYKFFDKVNEDIDKMTLNNSHHSMIKSHKDREPFF